MKVAVVGAGALGAIVAQAAGAAGHDVTVFVRTPINALTIEHDGDVVEVPVAIATGTIGQVHDVVFVAVKATATESIAAVLESICGPATLTVVVQNGLDQAARVEPFLPAGAATAALAYIAAERRGPGLVRHQSGDLLIVDSRRADTVADAVRGGLRVRGSDDMVTESWRKLLANLVANPITAILGQRTDVFAIPALTDLARRILAEAVAVGRAEGAHLPEGEAERVLAGLAKLGRIGSSMLYDRRDGRPMEHQYLTGEVVRRGIAHHLAVPTNATLLALLDALDAGTERPDPPNDPTDAQSRPN